MFTRIALLLSLSWMIGLTRPIFSAFDHPVSGRDLILLLGRLFLLGKSTWEIHENLEGPGTRRSMAAGASFLIVIIQIMILDIVFSLDSVITAVGMVRQIPVMIAAIVLAIGVMLFAPSAKFFLTYPFEAGEIKVGGEKVCKPISSGVKFSPYSHASFSCFL